MCPLAGGIPVMSCSVMYLILNSGVDTILKYGMNFYICMGRCGRRRQGHFQMWITLEGCNLRPTDDSLRLLKTCCHVFKRILKIGAVLHIHWKHTSDATCSSAPTEHYVCLQHAHLSKRTLVFLNMHRFGHRSISGFSKGRKMQPFGHNLHLYNSHWCASPAVCFCTCFPLK